MHGEAGVERRAFMAADALVDTMMARVVGDLPFERGDRVALLLNSLGATTMMELMIANRRARHRLEEAGLTVGLTFSGPYFTCQEMAGFSISLMRLDENAERMLRMPAWSLGFRC